jgi:hypothetical protein
MSESELARLHAGAPLSRVRMFSELNSSGLSDRLRPGVQHGKVATMAEVNPLETRLERLTARATVAPADAPLMLEV